MGGGKGGEDLKRGVEVLTQGVGRCIGDRRGFKDSGHLSLPVGRGRALTRAGVTTAVGLPSPAIIISLLLEAHILGSRGTLLRRNLTGRSAGGLAAVGSVALPGVVVPLRFLIRVTARSRLRRAFSRLCRTTTTLVTFGFL